MDMFLAVCGWVFGSALWAASLLGIGAAYIIPNKRMALKVVASGLSLLVFLLITTFGVNVLNSGESDASHCGPGTKYVSHTYIVGKVVIHDWACVVNN